MQRNRFLRAETMLIGAGSLTWALVAGLGFNQDMRANLPIFAIFSHLTLYTLFILLFLLLTTQDFPRKNLNLSRLLSGA
ncbi:MAG: two-component sensor histidine kinase, partial [Shewanella sp.]